MAVGAFGDTRLRALCAVFISALVVLGSAPSASAQSEGSAEASDEIPTPDQQARTLFAQGEAAYGEGRFEEALERFQRAYELSGRSELLYNVGISATNAGRDSVAIEAFERYLAELPDAGNRALVEGRLVSLRRQVAEQDAAARQAEADRAAAVEQERARQAAERAGSADTMRTAGWALTISGGVLVVAGAVFLGLGYADIGTVQNAPDGTPWVDLRSANDRAPIFTGLGWGGLGLGVALAGAGLGLALGAPSSEAPVTVSFGLDHVSVRGVF